MRAERYGEGRYETVGFLIYDGLHYNYLCVAIPGVPDITQFGARDPVVVRKVEAIVRTRNESGAFTNTNSFKLKCSDCGAVVVGETGAQAHNSETRHARFEEVKSAK
jgi:ubiquitin thioesterase OTU1